MQDAGSHVSHTVFVRKQLALGSGKMRDAAVEDASLISPWTCVRL